MEPIKDHLKKTDKIIRHSENFSVLYLIKNIIKTIIILDYLAQNLDIG